MAQIWGFQAPSEEYMEVMTGIADVPCPLLALIIFWSWIVAFSNLGANFE